MRIKLIKDYKQYKVGQVLRISSKAANKLITEGYAVMTKDMTLRDYKVAGKAK